VESLRPAWATYTGRSCITKKKKKKERKKKKNKRSWWIVVVCLKTCSIRLFGVNAYSRNFNPPFHSKCNPRLLMCPVVPTTISWYLN
jgi:hypothetical protein